ncbi:hypothetical protein ABEX53_12895 [Bacillus toyonensis]|uniref:Uncharacterized protein n=1 Tax=Bacillus thuringiensis serovar mexicanensis TaxID=180868 RepID=A0A242VZN4_BACTU|nr:MULTISPECIES: hypothetical protein [Bacillus cereus group]AFU17597.1 hypothetical protein MC28_F153 [Bacillus thuringiensis MC28]OTW44611.1 hypothetical protein BK699_30735 [Bacillus thuringiensis serovar mexicanensis]OTW98765.1 hypothetical protein BK705_22860 [Bacillus thuringiensis serovar monterrey]MED3540666.1 hypothetical protein [Bacillus toyonensis]MEE2022165.1 hypothetical protein [Bacillus toyonensis]
MKGTWIKVAVCSSLVILGILIGYVTHVFIQENISESNQDQVNTFHDEIGPNQRQPSFIEGGNSGFGTTKEYNEGEVESKDPGSN